MHGDGGLLLVTWSGGGNVSPLVALGCRLQERGHHVRVLGPAELAERFEAEGMAFRPHRSGEEWTGGNPIEWPNATDEQRMAYLRGMADDVLDEVRRRRTDVVVDYMQPDALCAAERSGLPVVAFVHTLYASQAAGARSPMNMAADVSRRNTMRAGLGLDPLGRTTELLDRAARVLVTTVAEVDRPSGPVAANVRYVGPLVEGPGPNAGWTPPWTPADAPLVVVSLGTTPMGEGPVLQRLVDALADCPSTSS